MRARISTGAAVLWAAASLACQSPPPPRPLPPDQASALAGSFDSARAWQHLEAFAAIGPRVMGTQGAAQARSRIVAELERLDLQVQEQGVRVERQGEPVLQLRNVAARIPGASSDVLLLIAPYDTRHYADFRHAGVNEGGSGAAVLLELARVLAQQPLRFTVWVVFLEGEAPLGADIAAESSHFGSRGFARKLVELEAVPHIRMGVVIDRVCDADLRIARDLGSHRIYREQFWRAAARIGRVDAFPRRAAFESPRSSAEALAEVGLRRVVTLTDTSFGGNEPPGLYAGNENDVIEHCSAESLGTVGMVTLESLSDISERLARIDRFSESPIEGTEELRLERLRESEVAPPGEGTPAGGTQDVAESAAQAPDVAESAAQAPDAAESAAQVPDAAQEAAEGGAQESAAPQESEKAEENP